MARNWDLQFARNAYNFWKAEKQKYGARKKGRIDTNLRYWKSEFKRLRDNKKHR